MAAPEAPTIHVHQFGGKLRVSWRAVDDATDYNVYLGEDIDPTGVEESLAEIDGQSNGWFVWWSPFVTVAYVRVTALNALAEESDYSNQVRKRIHDADMLTGKSLPLGIRHNT